MLRSIFYEILAAISAGLGCAFFLEMFSEKRQKTDWGMPIFAAAFIVVSIIQAQYEQRYFISNLGVLICPMLYALVLNIFYHCKYEIAFVWQLFYGVTVAVLKLPTMAFQGINGEKMALIWYIVVIVLVSVFHRAGKRTFIVNLKSMLEERKSSLFGIAILEWSMLTVVLYAGQETEFMGELLLGLIVFYAIGILFWNLYTYHSTMKRSEQEMVLQQAVLLREQKTIKEYYNRDARRLHDMKHVLLYLYKCIEENSIEKAKEYLESYMEEVAESQKKIWTGFTEIDFSVNYYYQLMQEKGILFSIETDVQEVPLEDLEMMIVLGNLLDNAMTAAEKCILGNRKVWLKMKNVNDMFFMRIENSSSQMPQKEKGRFLSSKKERECHGWGIDNVKQIVENQGGEIHFQYSENYFCAEILMFET